MVVLKKTYKKEDLVSDNLFHFRLTGLTHAPGKPSEIYCRVCKTVTHFRPTGLSRFWEFFKELGNSVWFAIKVGDSWIARARLWGKSCTRGLNRTTASQDMNVFSVSSLCCLIEKTFSKDQLAEGDAVLNATVWLLPECSPSLRLRFQVNYLAGDNPWNPYTGRRPDQSSSFLCRRLWGASSGQLGNAPHLGQGGYSRVSEWVCSVTIEAIAVNKRLCLSKSSLPFGIDVSTVLLFAGYYVLGEAFVNCLKKSYKRKILQCPTEGCRLFICCFRGTVPVLLGSFDPSSTTQFLMNEFKEVEMRDRIVSCPVLRWAIVALIQAVV